MHRAVVGEKEGRDWGELMMLLSDACLGTSRCNCNAPQRAITTVLIHTALRTLLTMTASSRMSSYGAVASALSVRYDAITCKIGWRLLNGRNKQIHTASMFITDVRPAALYNGCVKNVLFSSQSGFWSIWSRFIAPCASESGHWCSSCVYQQHNKPTDSYIFRDYRSSCFRFRVNEWFTHCKEWIYLTPHILLPATDNYMGHVFKGKIHPINKQQVLPKSSVWPKPFLQNWKRKSICLAERWTLMKVLHELLYTAVFFFFIELSRSMRWENVLFQQLQLTKR